MAETKKGAAKPAAISGKYGRVTTERGTFHDGEPVFILRASDKGALAALSRYRNNVEESNAPREFLDSLDKLILDFTEWRVSNKDKVKNPD